MARHREQANGPPGRTAWRYRPDPGPLRDAPPAASIGQMPRRPPPPGTPPPPDDGPPPPGSPPRHREPRVPFTEIIGRDVDEAADTYRADGFSVQVLDLEHSTVMTMEYRHNRIRLLARGGRVVRAHHG